eukprot:scaffold1091_cov164-Ochromonas_danica.AAC.1
MNHHKSRILGTRDGHSIPADILFVADGSRSSLRSLLSSCPGGTSGVESHLHFRGYRVFRGIASHPSREAFQTWAPGSRFAVVPLTEGEVAWFAAISSPDPSDTAITMEGPLANETRLATLSERDALLSLFQSHHAPVMDLLSSTPQSNIFVTDSFVSSSRYRPQVAAYLHAQRTPVLFLGDARHTLDPILAQGAGRALEDAWSVCQILGDRLLSPPQLVQAYEQKGGERIRRLERMSSLAEFFGHVDSPVGCRVRDASLNALPMAWKRTAFDRLIQLQHSREVKGQKRQSWEHKQEDGTTSLTSRSSPASTCDPRDSLQVIAHALRLLVQRHVGDIANGIQRALLIAVQRPEQGVQIGLRRPLLRDQFEGLGLRRIRRQAGDEYLGYLRPRDHAIAGVAGMPRVALQQRQPVLVGFVVVEPAGPHDRIGSSAGAHEPLAASFPVMRLGPAVIIAHPIGHADRGHQRDPGRPVAKCVQNVANTAIIHALRAGLAEPIGA